MQNQKFIDVIARWTLLFGKPPTIGQKVRLRPDFDYYDEWPKQDLYLIGVHADKYRGAEFKLSYSMEDHSDSSLFEISDVMPSEVDRESNTKSARDIFASRSLQVNFILIFEPEMEVEWEDIYHDRADMIEDHAKDLTKALLVEKAKRSENIVITPLDELALIQMETILEDAFRTKAKRGEFDSWAHMIASKSYTKAEEMLTIPEAEVTV